MSKFPQTACRQLHRAMKRREVLQVGGSTALGLSMPALLRARDQAAPSGTFGKARQVILLYLHGGHPQQETYDPKPHGPSAVKGEFGAIATSNPGLQFGELLPKTAQLAHKLTILRSLTHSDANHVHASYPANTGHTHLPNVPRGDFPPSDDHFPPYGAVVDKLRPATGNLPSWVRVGPLMRRSNGTVLHGQNAGFLGARHASFVVDQKLRGDDVQVEAVQPSDGLSSMRLTARRDLLQQFDEQRRVAEQSLSARQLDTYYDRAFSLLSSETTRQAFQLSEEPASLRARYGDTEFGQRCVLARRLAEAGVPVVNVSYCHTPSGSWDTHSRNFKKLKQSLAPTLDAAFSALVNDLDDRGRLDDTLVIVMAEFGRTPKINKNSGRDHWPWVYSFAFAGAGVEPGAVFGASDESAAYPAENPVSPADFAATLYHLLGVPASTMLYDKTNRPHHLIVGKAIEGILA